MKIVIKLEDESVVAVHKDDQTVTADMYSGYGATAVVSVDDDCVSFVTTETPIDFPEGVELPEGFDIPTLSTTEAILCPTVDLDALIEDALKNGDAGEESLSTLSGAVGQMGEMLAAMVGAMQEIASSDTLGDVRVVASKWANLFDEDGGNMPLPRPKRPRGKRRK